MAGKIEKLTPEQVAKFPGYAAKWKAIGLSTEPMDFEGAKAALSAAYRIAGKEPPKTMVRCGSPLGAVLTVGVLRSTAVSNSVSNSVINSVINSVSNSVSNSVIDSVINSVSNSVSNSVIDSVRNSVSDSVRGSVRALVGDSASDSVIDSVRNSVSDSVINSVSDPVINSISNSVINSVRASVSDSVSDSVGASVRALVGDSVGASVRALVGDSVSDSVGASVVASVRHSVRASVRNSVSDSVSESVGASVVASVRESVIESVGASVIDSVGASVVASVSESVIESVRHSVIELTYWWWRAFGQWDSWWLSFYDYCNAELGVDNSKLAGLSDLSKCAGMSLCFWDYAFISERPTTLHLDAQDRLHNPTEPAITYPDGWQLWYVHGIAVSEQIVTHPETVTVKMIEAETNAEVRRVMVERYGATVKEILDDTEENVRRRSFARFLVDAKAKEIHRDDTGVLYRRDFEGGEPHYFVRVVNGTVEPDGSRREFVLSVPQEDDENNPMTKAKQAVAWTYAMSEKEYDLACRT